MRSFLIINSNIKLVLRSKYSLKSTPCHVVLFLLRGPSPRSFLSPAYFYLKFLLISFPCCLISFHNTQSCFTFYVFCSAIRIILFLVFHSFPPTFCPHTPTDTHMHCTFIIGLFCIF